MRRRALAIPVLASLCLAACGTRGEAADGRSCRGARLALAIGNAAYPGMTDGGERNAAEVVASTLKRLGFATVLAEDVGRQGLKDAVAAFVSDAVPDSVAFLFFAGVAVQAGGRGYLLATDAAISSEADVEQVGISIDRIVSDLTARGAKLKVIVIDGARRNPFEPRFRLDAPAGLPPLTGSPGTLALYSSSPETAFEDEPGRRGIFAGALAAAMELPGVKAEEAIRHAKAAAARAFQGSQTPWVSSFLDEDIPLSAKHCPPRSQADVAVAPALNPTERTPEPPPAPETAAPVGLRSAPPQTSPPTVAPLADGTPVPAEQPLRPADQAPPGYAGSANPSPALVPPVQAPTANSPPATPAVTASLEPSQPPGPLPPAPPTNEAAAPADDTVTDEEHLKEIADRLFERGFDPGAPNASGLASAVRAYERSTGLSVDGRPSVKLLDHLRGTAAPSTWGAIAFGPKIGKWGVSWAVRSRRDALAQADARCGGSGCTAVASFHDQGCGALAISARTFSMSWEIGLERARGDATSKCALQGAACRVIVSICADGAGRPQLTTNDQQGR